MRFLAAKTGCKLSVQGEDYVLNPLSYPEVNIHDILAGEYGYVYRTVRECAHIREIRLEAEKIPGFPATVTDLSAVPGGSKVLIMRVGGLGDMVMLTPVLRYIKETLPPDTELTLATFRYAQGLFEKGGLVQRVIPSPVRLSRLLEYDYVIEFFEEDDVSDCRTSNMTDHYFRVIGVDGRAIDLLRKRPFLPPDTASAADVADFFARARRAPWQAVALMSLFSSDRTRDFPFPLFEQLVKRFERVLFVVPYQDADRFRGKTEGLGAGNVVFLHTAESLTDYLTAIFCSDIVVSPDSSAYHVAAAYGKPAIALFGSIDPGLRTRYYPTVTPLCGFYQGEFCTSPCGVSNAKWIRLDDAAGREIQRRNLYDPEKGCPEALRRSTDYSPCLLAVPAEDLFQAFARGLEKSALEKNKATHDAKRMKRMKTKKKEPTLSACMIVKNEEALLPQCLESIRNVVDEMVIVDTGSTDGTVRIAESFGAKVYHHPWENDFSKHRNQSISYASGDWILIIDADEKLDAASAPLVRKAIRESSSPMVAVMVRSFTEKSGITGGGLSVRLFQNGRGIHYEGIIHNQIQIIARPRYYPIVFWHYGYNLDEETLRRKRRRSLDLLLKQAEASPDDPVTHHHLAVTYFAEKMWAEAVASAEKTLELQREKAVAGIGWTFFIRSFSLYKLGRLDEAIEKARGGLEPFPRSIDLHHLLACLSLEKKDHNSVFRHAAAYFRLKREYEQDPSAFGLDVFEMDQKEGDVHMAEGFSLYLLGRREEAFTAMMKAEQTLRENRGEKLGQIGRFYFSREEYEKALHFFQAIGIQEAPFDRNILAVPHCLEKLGRSAEICDFYDGLHRTYPGEGEPLFQKGLYLLQTKDYEGAAEAFGLAGQLAPGRVDILFNLGVAFAYLGKTGSAEEAYLGALKLDPDHSDVSLNLGILYYREGRHEEARPHLEKACAAEQAGLYPMLALSHVCARTGEIERIVPLCGRLLRSLDLPDHHQLERVSDLGHLFYQISREFLHRRDLTCHEIAYRVGHLLAGQYPAPLLAMAEEAIRMGENRAGRGLLRFIEDAYPHLKESRM